MRTTEHGWRLRGLVEDLWADLEAMTTAGMGEGQRGEGQRGELLDLLAQAERNLVAGPAAAGRGVEPRA